MPYSGPNDSRLPKYVKSKSFAVRKKWVSIFNAAYDKYGNDSKAIIIANTWLKKELGSKKLIKRSSLVFEVVKGKKLIKRSSNGEDYITMVLANTNINTDGKSFTEENLKRFEKQINAGALVGDIDHALYDKLLESSMSVETIAEILKGKKGIAKTIKAIYEKGKLWVRAFVDKRYSRVIENSRGVSLEAIAEEGTNQWDLLGFSFNVKTTPAVPGAGVI